MAARDDVFRQALGIPPPGAAPPGPVSPAAAIGAYGGGATGRSELAMSLAGTRDKRSRAYRNARRNVERWERGRRPAGAAQGRLNDAYRQGAMAAAANRLRRSFSYVMRGVRLAISESRRTVPWIARDVEPRDIADASADFRDLLRQGREEEAFDALEETLMLAYDLDREDTIEELDELILMI